MAETTTTTDTSSDSTTTTTDDKPDELGAAGVKALAEERAARQAAAKAAKAAQTELDRLRAELKKREDADLSETEKLRKQLAESEAANQTIIRDRQAERTRFAIEREAARLRFADPADAWSLIDQASIDFDSNGNPTNLGALLEGLAKAKPYLTARPGTGAGEGGARGGNATGVSMDDWLRRAAGR